MPSRPLLILGNVIAITVTIAAFAGAVSWTIAGILILASLVIPLLVNIAPPTAELTQQLGSKAPNPNERMIKDATIQDKSHHARQQVMKPPQHEHGPIVPSIVPPQASPAPRLPPIKQGPDLNPTIAKDDYVEYDVELEAGKDFLGEVSSDGLVNVYLLDEENLDNLDEGEEFWSETGEEGVETATLEFTAPSKGRWFFVVENADDREITAYVKIQNGPVSETPA